MGDAGIENRGTITGGNAGTGLGTARGGEGVSVIQGFVDNYGTISGGLNGDGTRANAVHFYANALSSDLNLFEGWQLDGNAVGDNVGSLNFRNTASRAVQ